MDGESKPTAKAELLAANKQLSQKLVAWEVEAAHDVLEMAEQLESELGKMGDACQPILASCFAMVSLVASNAGCRGHEGQTQ